MNKYERKDEDGKTKYAWDRSCLPDVRDKSLLGAEYSKLRFNEEEQDFTCCAKWGYAAYEHTMILSLHLPSSRPNQRCRYRNNTLLSDSCVCHY